MNFQGVIDFLRFAEGNCKATNPSLSPTGMQPHSRCSYFLPSGVQKTQGVQLAQGGAKIARTRNHI